MQRLESKLRLVSRRGEARGRAAARPDHTMKIDVVRHLVIGMILEMKLDGVSLAHPDETPGSGATKCPEGVAHPFGDFLLNLAHFEVHDDFGGPRTMRRRRHIRRRGEDGAEGGAEGTRH